MHSGVVCKFGFQLVRSFVSRKRLVVKSLSFIHSVLSCTVFVARHRSAGRELAAVTAGCRYEVAHDVSANFPRVT